MNQKYIEIYNKLLYKKLTHDIAEQKISSDMTEYYIGELAEAVEFVENIKSPIEKIMACIIFNCENQYDGVRICGYQNPHWFGSGVECQVGIGSYKADFVITTSIGYLSNKEWTIKDFSKIVIECDGHDFHEKTKEQAVHDKKRDRYMTAEGYKVLRFTGSEIFNDYDSIIKEITNIIKDDILLFEENEKSFVKKAMEARYEK